MQRTLTTWELNRLKRYILWIRRLEVREWDLPNEITRLVVPASARTPPVLRLHLQELNWWPDKSNLSFLHEFLSPHLTKVNITTKVFVHPAQVADPWDKELPEEVVLKMRSVIKMLPPSPQRLCIRLWGGLETRLTEEISAFILRCGESLREFSTNLVLSTQAIVHLMKLPNLRAWATKQGPPQVTNLIHHGVPEGITSLFPSLETLDIDGEAALEWLSLFEAANNNTLPWIMAGGSLSVLTYRHPTLPIGSPLITSILSFAGLTDLLFEVGCFMRPCVSTFTDQDVERLAIALPRLEALTLGELPCGNDTCPTTVRSLLFLSVHCTKLRYLNIHFRMANLRADMLDLLSYAYSQGLQSKPKCPLEALMVWEMRPKLADYDPVLISIGMFMIFPSLVKFSTMSPAWIKVGVMVKAFGQIGEQITVMTENFMRILNEEREQAGSGSPVRSAVSNTRLSFGLSRERDRTCVFY